MEQNRSKESDPFSFYTLDSINDDGEKYWRMDCRLEYLGYAIMNTSYFMVDLFKKIYFDTFYDNNYRENYGSFHQITECDLEQLLQNILILSKPTKFFKKFRELVIKKSTYKKEKNDKFQLYSDDVLQCRRFETMSDVEDGDPDVFNRLFSNISMATSKEMFLSRVT